MLHLTILFISSIGREARGLGRTLFCSALHQNGEILNVCNPIGVKQLAILTAFQMPFLGSFTSVSLLIYEAMENRGLIRIDSAKNEAHHRPELASRLAGPKRGIRTADFMNRRRLSLT